MTSLPADAPVLIEAWFRKRGLSLPEDFIEKVAIHHDLIISWSKKMNLVSRGDLHSLVERHFLDSLTPLAEIPEVGHLADIGSGAGFPVIPIALVRPELRITMIEARHKKILFLREVCERLNLSSVALAEIRLEDLDPETPYDIMTMRALPGWEEQIGNIKRILKPSGKLIYYERPGKCRLIENF